ncbi:TPA: preprotein translocase subunit SecA [Candidatus Berkelbacteria bacterium]|uniref:Protein translocase subunit SecA n=1 Tax=Berkelbacteria bacterium GW2011_GWE1_39_12 TaxID=1618337 RepID=A0A0G4B3G6_9BACT|nr:MAG: Preprotein translocase subunit SecA, preprotein translocase subunit SecA [Berkelbacteria bacterium GW2011_GWE1_39_12]HBO60418.1 preprotein translocase subunit SecA [Candidatus Berkelbacteria bacterium]
MPNFFSKLFGSNEGVVKRMQPLVDKINSYEVDYEKLSDDELKNKTKEFKERLAKNETLDDLMPEAFASVREAAKRTIGQRHFDVQLIGGIVLHQGKIAEMKTGEGKTLVATLPLYLNALEGKGAHLITVNDYLARFHCAWMGQVYYKLGLSTAVINHEKSFLYVPEKKDAAVDSDQDPVSIEYANLKEISRKAAYAADITYGTNNEFGFDFLRDNMVQTLEHMVQRDLNFAIVDEVDSILIDEARTPLIISAPAEESASLYRKFALLVKNLKDKEDFAIDEKMHSVTLTDAGIDKVEKSLGISEIYSSETIHLVHHLEEALIAENLYKRNKDYVVKDGEVIIVDEFTGRMMPGRRYSEGLHQAIEAKENVEVQRESDTLATISFQNLFRMYNKLAGMTGTASTEAEEFWKIYKLDVVEIPTNKENIRKDSQDQIYKSEDAKFHAVAREVIERSKKGQPVLIGTISIEKSEKLSKMLKRDGVKHEVLNAKHHEREAKIIEQAGRVGAVTVATNMAGRGVDIILGGVPLDKEKREAVAKLGGLHIIGTERHESRRIDNQLRGRAGRQGDPGSSLFYVSMEDDLMRIFGGEKMKNLMDRLNLPDDMPIEHGLISRSIESAQRKVEGHNFDIRKHLVDYDDVANKHRQAIYTKRRAILQGANIHQEIIDLMDDQAKEEYLTKYNKIGEEVMSQIERMVYLRSIDTMWIEHLNAMDMLREGIGLQGYGQRDPLVEYKSRAYGLFQRLNEEINGQVVDVLLKADIRPVEKELTIEQAPINRSMQLQVASEEEAAGTFDNVASSMGEEPITVESDATPAPMTNNGVEVTVRKTGSVNNSTTPSAFGEVGRNDPCPCGSGKKYKKCHGK